MSRPKTTRTDAKPGRVVVAAPAGQAPAHAGTALEGVRIPSRSSEARRLVAQLYSTCGHLTIPDLWAAVRWAELSLKFRRLAEYMDTQPGGGVVRVDGEPRRAVSELRQLADAISRHEASLGVSASARAGLGVNLGRMQDLASLMSGRDAE